MKTFFYSLSFLSVLLSVQVSAQNFFIPNQGQITDQHNQLNSKVLYLFSQNSLNIQLHTNGISYDSYVADKESPMQFHRVDIEFINANQNPEIEIIEKTDIVLNNFINGKNLTINPVRKLKYKNLYPDIDLVCYSDAKGNFEFDFVIKAGANPNQIQWKYSGQYADFINSESKVELKLQQGSLFEAIPNARIGNREIQIKYKKIAASTYAFDIPEYNPNEDLVIDPLPSLSWGSYYGGSLDEQAKAIAHDNAGNLYITGSTSSVSGIATTGAYQNTLNSAPDAFLAKFSSAGNLLMATYFGASRIDVANDLVISGNNVLIGGYSSSPDLAVTQGTHQTAFGGQIDAFLYSFDLNGTLNWSTFFGGDDEDYAIALTTDSQSNIYIAGKTKSTNAIATTGVHQEVYNGGVEDGLIAKFSSNGTLLWGTYFGGSLGIEYCNDLKIDSNEDIIFCGTTESPNNVATDTSQIRGAKDAFLGKMNGQGIVQWCRFFGGASDDFGQSLVIGTENNIYLSGHTLSAGISKGEIHQSNLAGATDAFIAKFNSNSGLSWSTYFGGTGTENVESIILHQNNFSIPAVEEVVICGFTNSNEGIAGNQAYQKQFGGAGALNKGDAFIAKFNGSGKKVWGSYYGGSNDDFAVGLTEINEQYFVAGTTYSQNNIALNATYQSTNAGNADVFIANFCDYPSPFYTTLKDVYCETESVNLTSLDSLGVFYKNGVQILNRKYEPNPTFTSTGSIGTIKFDTLVYQGQWAGCTSVNDTIIVRVLPVYRNYFENFENSAGNWWTDRDSSVWEYALGANGTKVWSIRPNEPSFRQNDEGYLYSPCVDLSTWGQFVISFDYANSMRQGLDGVQVQYFDNNNNKWKLLGDNGYGENWYNTPQLVALAGKPAWTGSFSNYGQTLVGKYALSNAKSKFTRLRFYFKALDFPVPAGNKGFYFDNIKIEAAKGYPLIENFYNRNYSNPDPAIRATAEYIDQSRNIFIYYNEQNFDSIPPTNNQEKNARALFYGVSFNDDPQTVLSGNLYNDNTFDSTTSELAWNKALIDDEILRPTLANIKFDSIRYSPVTNLWRSYVLTDTRNLLADSIEPVLFIALIDTAYVASPGDTIKNMFIKMLPNTAGIPLTKGVVAGHFESLTLTSDFRDPRRLGVIAWIQDLRSKKIYQSAYGTLFQRFQSNILINVNELNFNDDVPITLFPNPVDNILNIKIEDQNGTDIRWKIWNISGLLIEQGKWSNAGSLHQINLKDMPGGQYIIGFESDKFRTFKKFVKE
jgi:hypothetical protein